MGQGNSCVETILHNGEVYLLDGAQGEDFENRGYQLGPLTEPLDRDEYEARRLAVADSGDARLMFDHPNQYAVLSDSELAAYAAYLTHPLGRLAFTDLVEHESVIAYESRKTLPVAA